jgi:hypothetical protein
VATEGAGLGARDVEGEGARSRPAQAASAPADAAAASCRKSRLLYPAATFPQRQAEGPLPGSTG